MRESVLDTYKAVDNCHVTVYVQIQFSDAGLLCKLDSGQTEKNLKFISTK